MLTRGKRKKVINVASATNKKIPSMGLASQSLGSSIMIGRLIIILTVDSLDFLAHELSVIFESLHFTVHLVNKAVAFLT